MKLSNKGIALIKNFEGLRLKAYKDPAGVWTIGYGSTKYHDDKPVHQGDILTSEIQATSLFCNTLMQYENAVNNNAKVILTQNQFDALVSITYNVGIGIMQMSTLIKKINIQDYAGAADQFLMWNKITDPNINKKVVNETLTERRKKEREYFLSHE